jgi:hypothetical protein
MYLLDTTIVSLFDIRRKEQAAAVIDWIRSHDASIHISVMSLMEIEAGILRLLREGKSQRAEDIIELRDGLSTGYTDRLLPVTADVALTVARLGNEVRPMVIEQTDLIIAATAKVHGLTVLTRNLRHFTPTGVPALDPLVTLPPG